MKYILSGNPVDVQKVIQENRVRCQRGVIKFTPLATARDVKVEQVLDDKITIVTDTKEMPEMDTKTIKPKRTKKSE